jgi:dTDP-4-amino-4,6-dideoxygalactose transaminase
MINVTKTYLPPLEEYVGYLERIWASNQLTNNGPLVKELEAKLKEFLGVKHLFFVSNGTIALQIAIKALGLHDEIITTPFSYVATISSIVWEGCQPVFVDIDPETLCLNPDLIEAAITPRTTAILAVHVYGHPCAVERIQAIADRHGLKVIYDAAHAFGVRYKGPSLLTHGDISTLSFHATKLFHTVEGGALVTNDDEIAHRIGYMRNFGHKGPEDFWGLGINGKNSEFHAAMGLSILPAIDTIIAERKRLSEMYDRLLSHANSLRPRSPSGTLYNYAYYPVLFRSAVELLSVRTNLNANNIFPRRYFYPSLNTLNYVPTSQMPVSESTSERVLCLPLYDSLGDENLGLITGIVRKALACRQYLPHVANPLA